MVAGDKEAARYRESARRGDELLREAEKLRKKRDKPPPAWPGG